MRDPTIERLFQNGTTAEMFATSWERGTTQLCRAEPNAADKAMRTCNNRFSTH